MLEYFRYLYLIPFVSIVLAKSKAAPIIISGFIILSFVYLLIPNFHREDWRTLAAAIPSDTPVLVIPSFSDPLNYYHPGLTLVDIRRLDLSAPRYIVIPYGTAIYGFNYQNHLNSQNFHLVSTAVFRQNTLELWSR